MDANEEKLKIAIKALEGVSGWGFGWDGDYGVTRCADEALSAIEAIATPVAAGSVDTEEFDALLTEYATQYMDQPAGDSPVFADARAKLIAGITAWGAQQREAGRLERDAGHESDMSTIAALNTRAVDKLRDRAEKAEARVKELEARLEFECSPSRIDDLQYVLKRADSFDLSNCDCHSCQPITMQNNRMILCAKCGNKRCPHAKDHRNACTGSNEPGQAGSAYA